MGNQKKTRGHVPQHRKEPERPPGMPGALAAKIVVAGVAGAATLAIPVGGALAASAPVPGGPAAGTVADSVTGIPTTLASPPLVGPAPPSRNGSFTFSGFGGVHLPFNADDGITGVNPFAGLFITPPNFGKMPVGNIPLTFPPPSAAPSPGTAPAGGSQNFLDPAPSFDPLAHDRLIQGLINSGIGGGMSDQQVSDALARFQPQLPSLDSVFPGAAAQPAAPAVPFLEQQQQLDQLLGQTVQRELELAPFQQLDSFAGGVPAAGPPVVPAVPFLEQQQQLDQLLGQTMAPDLQFAPFEQLIQNAEAGGFAFPPRPVDPLTPAQAGSAASTLTPGAGDTGATDLPALASIPATPTVPAPVTADGTADAAGTAPAPVVVADTAPDTTADASAATRGVAPAPVADAPATADSPAPVVADAPAAADSPAPVAVADAAPAVPPAPVVSDPPPDVEPAPVVVAFAPPFDGGGAYYG